MPRTAGSRSEITGPAILKAALKLFARHGFAAVSMRQIAAEVNVQVGALYQYIPDKQTLLFDLMNTHMETLLHAWAQEPETSDPVEALRQFVRFHIRFHVERTEAVFVAYMELRSLSPENFKQIEAQRRAYETALETILRRGVRAGVFALHDTKITTLALIAMLTGVNTWYRQEGRLSLEDLEALYWDMVRKAVSA